MRWQLLSRVGMRCLPIFVSFVDFRIQITKLVLEELRPAKTGFWFLVSGLGLFSLMRIIQKKSPNSRKGRGGHLPIAVVIHVMEGTLAGTDAWFASKESTVSAHYGIGKGGEVHQYVQEEDFAQHAGVVDKPSWKLIKSTGEGTRQKYVNPNYYTIGIEHEGKAGEPFTDAMYEASSELIAAISERWQIPIDDQHVITHHSIRFAKSCPGAGVDMSKLIEMARSKERPGGQAA